MSIQIKTEIDPENPESGFYNITSEEYADVEAVSLKSIMHACKSLADYLYFKSSPQSPNKSFSLNEECRKSINRHPLGDQLLRGTRKDISIIWKEPTSGIMLKCMPDYIDFEKFRIVDFKPTKDSSPRVFARETVQFNYHVSAALMIDMMSDGNQFIKPEFYFLAVGNQGPFITEIYRLSPKSLQEGRLAYQKALDRLSRFFKHYDIYSGYSEGKVVVLDLDLGEK